MAVIENGVLKSAPQFKGGMHTRLLIDFKCGHTVEMDVYAASQSDCTFGAMKVEKKYNCPDCYKSKQQKTKTGLPELTGVSESQISFAKNVRTKTIKAVEKFIKNAAKTEQLKNQMEEDFQKMIAQTEATFWLDNRNVMALQVAANQ